MAEVLGGERTPLLVMNDICKRFPGVLALDNVDLELYPGEILGLIGENGAGKSTLMRILGGVYSADAGDILIDGTPAVIETPQHSIKYGISIIHQELNLAPNLDAASNIFLGKEPHSPFLKVIHRQELYARAAEVAGRVGLDVDMRTVVEDLSPAAQQLVEIARALSSSARLLVLDEPTSSLSATETSNLFAIMGELKAAGVSMIYITHRLHEVEEICDRVTVLRDGQRVGDLQKGEITRDNMVRLMVGREVSRFFPESHEVRSDETVLEVKGLRCPSLPGEFSFQVKHGEIFGISGLAGSGRTELVRSIFGVEPPISGEVIIDGNLTDIACVRDAVKAGIGLVPEDRKHLGLILEMAVKENISLPGLNTYHRWKLDRSKEIEISTEQCSTLSVKTPDLDQEVGYLSGGNQQKVALGKWLALQPRVLILDEPTRGIDVGSKAEIYRLVRDLADSGVAIVMVSSEMEEVIGLSDRVMIMHEGRLAGILDKSELSENRIMHMATGGEV